MSGYRLPETLSPGSRIKRDRELSFRFDHQPYVGFEGDTLASALLGEGEVLFGRSFKYHRPRGVMSAGVEESNALVTVGTGNRTEPNAKAPMVELYGGLEAVSQNRFPSLKMDFMSLTSLLSPIFVAGFYYKTFIGPFRNTKFWMFCETFIRNAAGMGAGTLLPDPDRYERTNAFAEVLVVGSGPAGLLAALMAARTGVRVILADENASLGGSVDEISERIEGHPAEEWSKKVLHELGELENVTLLPRTTVWGYFDDNTIVATERVTEHQASPSAVDPRQRQWTIQADKVVIATGAIERPLVFAGNDTPGVMLASAAVRYAKRYAVSVGQKVCVFTNNDSGLQSALQLVSLGVPLAGVIDARQSPPQDLHRKLAEKGVPLYSGSVVSKAEGGQALNRVTVHLYDPQTGTLSGDDRVINCDALAVSGGWTPTVHLASQAGDKPVFNENIQAFVPEKNRCKTDGRDWLALGSCTGEFDLSALFETTVREMTALLAELGKNAEKPVPNTTQLREKRETPILPLWDIPSADGKGKRFVDQQHDVTAADVELAQREGFESVEHLKRYTTLGMAADQGKTSNVNGLALMAKARAQTIPETGTTRFRPPYTPVTIGSIAGREIHGHMRPYRHTPLHDWHREQGAEMLNVGLWARPRIYGQAGETLEQSYVREARAVRQSVGIVDVSTLGKIDIQGPDAAELLNRVYSNGFKKLPVGKARYGLMLREDGFLYDDGTTWRLSENQFLMTTTTANAAGVMGLLEYYLAVVWPDLKVQVTSVTDLWSGLAISGPNARKVLQKVVSGLDLSNEGLPFMGVAQARIGEIPVWIARLSFSGELAYEVYAEANYGAAVWEGLMQAGEEFDILPYGLEALGTLRIEKGHIAGPELDGTTTVQDVGLSAMASGKKDYIGSVLRNRETMTGNDREQLVGLVAQEKRALKVGAHLLSRETGQSIGHVTSVTYSPALEEYIALALVENGKALIGETLRSAYPLKDDAQAVKLVSPHFYDPEGGRMHV
ncbi:sarcosine oxidase subunit alpha family protein [Kiloniella sp. b19]|uniref:sarcosine oxidase subunit alpha family protein n=1 Tax=Kiloniella sp. GXU_MW_B19 TaxID=3141326 RepID=UPI0031DE9E24